MRKLSWLMLVAIVAGLWAGVRLHLMDNTDTIAEDGITYIQMAREFAHSPSAVVADYDYAIGYPAAIAGVHSIWYRLTGDNGVDGWDRIGRGISFVASLAILGGLWLYCRRAFDDRTAFATLILLCVARKWAAIGAVVLSDCLALAFVIWTIVLALAVMDRLRDGRRSSLCLAVLVGSLAALGYLVRPEAMLAVVLAAALWTTMQVRRRQNVRLSLAAAGIAILSAAACALPYMIAIGKLSKKKSLGDFLGRTIDNSPAVIMAGFMPPGEAASAIPNFFGQFDGPVSAIVKFFGQFDGPVSAIVKLLGQFSEAIHPVCGLLLALWLLPALIRPLRRRLLPPQLQSPQPDVAFLMILGAAIMVPALIGLYTHVHYLSHRHLFMLGMLTSPLIGAGAVSVAWWLWHLAARAAKSLSSRTVLAVFLALCVVPMARHAVKPMFESGDVFRQAGLFVRGVVAPGDFVLTDNRYILHYCDRDGCCQPGGNFENLPALVAKHGSVILATRDADVEAARKRNCDMSFTRRCDGNGLVNIYAITMHHDGDETSRNADAEATNNSDRP